MLLPKMALLCLCAVLPLQALPTSKFISETIQMTEMGNSNAKPEIVALMLELQSKGVIVRTGKDADLRPAYVGAQAEFEKVMAYQLSHHQISNLVGIIHTPTPATPLCSSGEISLQLVDSAIAQDDKRLYTVKERTTVVREYLQQGGLLYALYPKGGREKRTAEQLAIFDQLLQKYPANLIASELKCTQMERDMVGATYFFQDIHGEWMVFSLMVPQANAPNDDQEWGIWWGSLKDPKVKKRADAVLQYIRDQKGPDINSIIN
jgi:hypothetical protein